MLLWNVSGRAAVAERGTWRRASQSGQSACRRGPRVPREKSQAVGWTCRQIRRIRYLTFSSKHCKTFLCDKKLHFTGANVLLAWDGERWCPSKISNLFVVLFEVCGCLTVCFKFIDQTGSLYFFVLRDWWREDIESGSSLYIKRVWNLAKGSLISCAHTSTAVCWFHSVLLDNSHCVPWRMLYLSEDVGEMGIHIQA